MNGFLTEPEEASPDLQDRFFGLRMVLTRYVSFGDAVAAEVLQGLSDNGYGEK